METILLVGGTGLIGGHLAKFLADAGHQVNILTRNPRSYNHIKWDPAKGEIDIEAIRDTTIIINLCGEGIAEDRWTESRKKELLYSRIFPATFLFKFADQLTQLKQYISASGINCYGTEPKDSPYVEDEAYGNDFLSKLVKSWEASADIFASVCTVSKLRISVVLTPKKGALGKMNATVRRGLGSALGSGDQIISWIHIDDLCGVVGHVIDQRLGGIYNTVGGNTSNKEFTQSLGKRMKKKVWLPNVPSFLLKLILGEMATLVLEGVNCSNEKLIETGYQFKYSLLPEALDNLELE